MPAALAGRRIWLTRPRAQGEAWVDAIAAAGGQALIEPLLEIEAVADGGALDEALVAAEAADIVIATSANAVAAAARLRPAFAPRGQLYAVGSSTADALAALCRRPVTVPAGGFSSESLIESLNAEPLADRRIAILAGEGGRQRLPEALRQRAAVVTKLALYRRRPAAIDEARLQQLVATADAVVVTSGEAMAHLADLVAASSACDVGRRLAGCRLVAPSARVVKHGEHRLEWIRSPVIVDRLEVDAVVRALASVWKGH